jgi:hypothetical protein
MIDKVIIEGGVDECSSTCYSKHSNNNTNVSVLGTQAMNPNIGYTIVHVPGKTSMLPTSTYPMWYNVIPPFIPLDANLYLVYPVGLKGLHPLIFKNYTGYVAKYVYPIPKHPIVPPTFTPHFVGN